MKPSLSSFSPQNARFGFRFGRPSALRPVPPARQAFQIRASSSPSSIALLPNESVNQFGIIEGRWKWTQKGHTIRYQRGGQDANQEKPALILLHGFGGNADHWRLNTPELSKHYRVYALDLLGYGYSDKPSPRGLPPNSIYNFENWSAQVRDFMDEFLPNEAAYIICNSVGGIAGLQMQIDDPSKVKGLMLINISLRMLHVSKQAPFARPFVKAFQTLLRETDIGNKFFANVARPQTVKSILQQAYHNPATVTDELVECILKPGLEPGAPDVFLDFISYSGGPLPEDLMPRVTCPLWLVWGEEDPWEKVEWGRDLAKIPTVSRFVPLPGAGHCPQDEAPQMVNPLILEFVETYAATSAM